MDILTELLSNQEILEPFDVLDYNEEIEQLHELESVITKEQFGILQLLDADNIVSKSSRIDYETSELLTESLFIIVRNSLPDIELLSNKDGNGIAEFIKRVGLVIAKWFRNFLGLIKKWYTKFLNILSTSQVVVKELLKKVDEKKIDNNTKFDVPQGVLSYFSKKKILKATYAILDYNFADDIYNHDQTLNMKAFDKYFKDNKGTSFKENYKKITSGLGSGEMVISLINLNTNDAEIRTYRMKHIIKDAYIIIDKFNAIVGYNRVQSEIMSNKQYSLKELGLDIKDIRENAYISKDEVSRKMDEIYNSVNTVYKDIENDMNDLKSISSITTADINGLRSYAIDSARSLFGQMTKIYKARVYSISLLKALTKD